MKKLMILLLCGLILVGMLLTGCTDTSGVPKEVREFAQTYLDACKEEDPEISLRMEILSPSIVDLCIRSYKPESNNRILEMKTLGSKLWYVKTERENVELDQFVVEYDGQYFFVANVAYIPQECREGLDLSEYEAQNADAMLPNDAGTVATLPRE